MARHHLIERLPVPVADSFIQSGAREHSIKPGNHFTYLEADDTPEDLNATVEGIANVKLLSGPLAAPRRVHDKRDYATFERCTQAEVEGIQLAIYSIWQEASTAYFGIWGLKEKHNDGWAVRYKRWFGPYTKPRYKTVKKLVWFMAKKVRFKNFVFRCRTGERDRAPARLSNYALQPWDCYSVADTSLDQSPGPGESRSSKGSGTAWSLTVWVHFST